MRSCLCDVYRVMCFLDRVVVLLCLIVSGPVIWFPCVRSWLCGGVASINFLSAFLCVRWCRVLCVLVRVCILGCVLVESLCVRLSVFGRLMVFHSVRSCPRVCSCLSQDVVPCIFISVPPFLWV